MYSVTYFVKKVFHREGQEVYKEKSNQNFVLPAISELQGCNTHLKKSPDMD
jgi:hypothetical protein